ncbi:MAG TPA: VWA domain-containing protein [Bryobacteraceae bacterium]|jgi:Ca-activated chloride channel family protein|nr:VWA domain-containing protein [Bryobacteraceae bacterium]
MKFILTFAAAAMIFGQSQPARFTADVRLVRLLVNVKNAKGELVGSLEKDQFTVFDDNVRQEIKVFERYTTTPLSVAALVDTSGSTRIDWQTEVRSITKFFKALFAEGNERDAASLFTFNYDVTQQSDFTRSSKLLEDRLKYIKPEGGTSLYDAIYHAARNLQSREGRHVMVLVSDGGNTTSSKQYIEAREAAQRADAVIYPIIVVPIQNDAGRNLGGEHALQQLAADTGGRWFDATIEELDKTFAEILRDLRAQYMIAYYPTDARKGFHQVRVELNRPDLRATTRTGYYGEDPR